jgi:hypothetical protein
MGFLVAYMLHAYIYGSGNILYGIKQMQVDLIERRTYGNAANYDLRFANSLNASVLDVLIEYFWSCGRPLDGKLIFVMAVATVVSLIYQRKVLKLRNTFEISLFAVTLLTCISWFILGKAHSYIHTGLNFVLFYMGWVQVSIYIICKTFFEKNKIQINIRGSKNDIVNI